MVRFGTLLLILLCVAPVAAQERRAETERLAEAERLAEEAEFGGALEALDALEAGGDLSREELVASLELRAMLQFATQSGAIPSATLLGLASLEPDFQMSSLRPPPLRAAFATAQRTIEGRLHLEVETTLEGEVVRLSARVSDDPAALVREVRLFARAPGTDEWTTRVGERLEHPGPALEYYAQAVGPGGALMDVVGAPDSPERFGAATADARGAVVMEPNAAGGDDLTWLWVTLAIVAAGAVAATITAVVLTSEPMNSQLQPPIFERP